MTSATLAQTIADIVVANHILARQGVVDGFGHISSRHPEDANKYLLSCSRAPELVSAADIMVFDLDSNPVDGATRTWSASSTARSTAFAPTCRRSSTAIRPR